MLTGNARRQPEGVKVAFPEFAAFKTLNLHENLPHVLPSTGRKLNPVQNLSDWM